MKELRDFNQMLGKIHKSLMKESVAYPNDYGSTHELDVMTMVPQDEKVTDLDWDLVLDSLGGIEAILIADGRPPKEVRNIIRKAIEDLIAQAVFKRVPNTKDSDAQRLMWLSYASPRIVAHLRLSGELVYF